MRGRIILVVVWALVTSAATGLAWRGVRLVSSEVTQRRVAPLSRSEVVEALHGGPSEEAGPSPEVSAGAPPALTSAPSPLLPATTAASPRAAATTDRATPRAPSTPRPAPSPTPASASPTTTSAPPAAGPATTATTAATTGTTNAPPPPPPPPPPPEATSTTIDSIGGQVAVRYEAERVELLWARPKPGFRVEVRERGPEEVELVFESDDHESRIRAFWRDGLPAHEVREQS